MGERGVAATGAACGAFGVASSRVRDGVAAAGAACGAFGSVDPWGRVAAENIPPGTSPLDKSRSASASVTGVRIALSLASSSSASPPRRDSTASRRRAAASPVASRGVPSFAFANEVSPWTDGVSGASAPGWPARNASNWTTAGIRPASPFSPRRGPPGISAAGSLDPAISVTRKTGGSVPGRTTDRFG